MPLELGPAAAYSTRVVPLVRRLGRNLRHVIRHHIESGAEGGGDVSEFDVLAKHVLMLTCRVAGVFAG